MVNYLLLSSARNVVCVELSRRLKIVTACTEIAILAQGENGLPFPVAMSP